MSNVYDVGKHIPQILYNPLIKDCSNPLSKDKEFSCLQNVFKM